MSGTIKYRVVFLPSGEVASIKITKGLGGSLAEDVAPVVKSIKFLPAEKDGRLVPQHAEISYNFILR